MSGMEILNKFESIDEDVALGMGFFDGVHIGHRKLICDLVSTSKVNELKTVLLTFKNSPAELFYSDVKYITLNSEREKLIESFGIDYMVELDFNDNLKKISAEDYLRKVCNFYKPKYIYSGFNHTFGFNKIGNSSFLSQKSKIYGYEFVEIPPIKFEEKTVSSTYIRELLKSGNVKTANKLLIEPFSISGKVIKGNQLGRTIGFPTANIDYPEKKAEIPYGVYCAEVKYMDNHYRGMLNYGVKPTVKNGKNNPVAEVYIIDFDKDIYGETIKISVLDKIRNEKKFESLEDLKNQIEKDLMKC